VAVGNERTSARTQSIGDVDVALLVDVALIASVHVAIFLEGVLHISVRRRAVQVHARNQAHLGGLLVAEVAKRVAGALDAEFAALAEAEILARRRIHDLGRDTGDEHPAGRAGCVFDLVPRRQGGAAADFGEALCAI
jgi:hypothetical protein